MAEVEGGDAGRRQEGGVEGFWSNGVIGVLEC
jgi:hypothetical protein